MNKPYLKVARLFLVLAGLVVIVWLLCGCVVYPRHMWSPADLRDGDVRVIQDGQDRMIVSEGYVHLLYKSYVILHGKASGEARLLSVLVRENEDRTWVIRKEEER